jgi:hypothetical protein
VNPITFTLASSQCPPNVNGCPVGDSFLSFDFDGKQHFVQYRAESSCRIMREFFAGTSGLSQGFTVFLTWTFPLSDYQLQLQMCLDTNV